MAMVNSIIKNEMFHKIATNVKPDVKKRIVLSKALIDGDVTYHIYCNEIGQILLDPHISIPVSEAWLYKNTIAQRAVSKGLKDAAEGKISKLNPAEL